MASDSNPWTSHYLDHEIIGLSREDETHIESLVKVHDWRVMIPFVSFLSTIESHSREFSGERFDDTIARLFVNTELTEPILQAIEDGAYLLNKFSLALMTEGSGGGPDSLQNQEAFIRFPSVSSGENIYSRIGRYFQILVEIPSDLKHDSNWMDITEIYRKLMGFQINRLFGLAFGVYSTYGALGVELNERWRGKDIPQPNLGNWILDSSSFLKSTRISPTDARQLMLKFSTSPSLFASDESQSDGVFDFTHLKTSPIVHLGGSRFCVPVLDYLIDRMTIRAYFDIFDNLGSIDWGKFGIFLGTSLNGTFTV